MHASDEVLGAAPPTVVSGAIHEAGHAAAALALGVRVGFVRLEPSGAGQCFCNWDGTTARTRAIVALAGLAAAELALPHSSAEHRLRARLDMDEAEPALQQLPDDERRQVGPATFDLVRQQWATVERIAAALLERGELYAADLERI